LKQTNDLGNEPDSRDDTSLGIVNTLSFGMGMFGTVCWEWDRNSYMRSRKW